MGDFISNDPGGKSDLHTFTPSPSPDRTAPSSEAAEATNTFTPSPHPQQAQGAQQPADPYGKVESKQASEPYHDPHSERPQGQMPPNPYQTQGTAPTEDPYRRQTQGQTPPNPYQTQSSAPAGSPSQGQTQGHSNAYRSGNGYQAPYQGANQAPHYGSYPPYNDPYGYAIYGAPPPVKSPKENYNIASLVLGIASWAGLILCCGCISPFTAIASIILAFIGKENGKFSGKAVAGIIMSVIFLAIFLFFVFILALGMSGAFDEPVEELEMMAAMLSRIKS